MSEFDELEQTPAEDADTVVDEGSPAPAEQPEQQDTPKKYAGKYESPEELERAYSELQRKLGEQGEQLGRAKLMLESDNPFMPEVAPVISGYPQAASAGVPAAAPTTDVDLGIDEAAAYADLPGALKKVYLKAKNDAAAEAEARVSRATQLNQMEKQFYATNKDLHPQVDKPLVEYYASKLAQLPLQVIQANYPDPMKAVAEAVREHKRRYVDEARTKQQTNQPPHVGPGGGVASAPASTAPAKPKSERESFDEYMAELRGMTAK
jgi:hypothetical protein